ncbi:hypothetical protein THRCLA_06166 [Thraustotheca clavata]|uniref:ADP-ribosylation factor family n=1 Tax=Thraustotheca clavata TaxID=74557 RepID=A0A1V9ZQ79_9STRA|nr:hypothetical protein THRCLA_06166 [Thraustotheca clavata]
MRVILVVGMDGAGKTVLLRRLRLLCREEKPKHGPLFGSASMGFFMRRKEQEKLESQMSIGQFTMPTTGIEEETLVYTGSTFTIREVGAPMLSMWKAYYSQCEAFMFVIDVTNAPQLATAAMELFNILHNDAMVLKGACIVLNKIDAPNALPLPLLRSVLCLDQIASLSNVEIIRVSAKTGENIQTVLQWATGRPRTTHRMSLLDANVSRVHPAAV